MKEFQPLLDPYQALELGIFDGKYYLATNPDFNRTPTITKTNLFAPNASQPLEVWQDKGWITPEDPMGWFQWYLRYHQGRRIEDLDTHQMKRWKSFVARHSAQVRKNGNGDLTKRLKQRQALLHWCADPIPDVEGSPQEKVEYLLKNMKLNEKNY